MGPKAIVADALRSRSGKIRVPAARALGSIGPDALSSVPALMQAVSEDPYEAFSREAVSALGAIGPAAAQAVPLLIATLGGRDDLRDQAIYALGRIGPVAVPALVATLSDISSAAREGAASALTQMGEGAGESVPALVRAPMDPVIPIRKLRKPSQGSYLVRNRPLAFS